MDAKPQSDTIVDLMWHPDLIKLFFQCKSWQQRVNLLEGLNTGNKINWPTKGTYDNKVVSAYVNHDMMKKEFVGGGEWKEKFQDYLKLESVIVKPFKGYWEQADNSWYLSEGNYGDIGYYVMEYCLVPVKKPQSINYLTLKLD